MEQINIAEILKDCPSGMELYSPIFGDVYLDEIRPHLAVVVRTSDKQKEEFLYDGRFGINGECMLFPSKENRDWSTFQRPFKDGDILYINYGGSFKYIVIFKEIISNTVYVHIYYSYFSNSFNIDNKLGGANTDIRFATEEEKQKLFKAIKDKGYKWNAETKTLEKLSKFKVGDKVKRKDDNYTYIVTISKLDGDYYDYVNEDGQCGVIYISKQDDWELVPNKFDITTLKAFDKVLVRQSDTDYWKPAFWGRYITSNSYPFITSFGFTTQAIPFKSNEHLLGTTNDCDDYFKTWE